MIRGIAALIRPKHWIKNGLIFLPLVFSGLLFDVSRLGTVFVAFLVFSFTASVVYIFNDIRDIESDKLHPKKKYRPLAAGLISVKAATVAAALLLACSLAIGLSIHLSVTAWLWLLAYFLINIAYSFGLKNIPIVDIAILSSGFIIRVLYGAEATDVVVSSWLYMTILAGALYMSLGKRRNEIQRNGLKSRKVNKHYSIAFLDKNMYVSLGLLFVFYSLWATDPSRGDSYMYVTIPLLMFTFMTYSLSIEKETSSGDPVDVLIGNRALLVLAGLSMIVTVGLVYF